MKNRLLIAGIGLLAFGLANFSRYLPISRSPPFWNTPFPFPYLQDVVHYEGGSGVSTWHMPLEAAAYDPYWLFWSMALYAGIIITGFAVWSRR